MPIIAKYKFDKSIYADLLPEFNTEFTSDLYNTTDEEVDGIITRTIESDELPTLMRFGRVWVNGEPATDNRTDSLLEILDMNTSGLTSMHSMFRYCKNLISISCEWDTSKVTDMYSMFTNCINLTSLDVSNFNTSKVTSMGGTFYGCNNLTSLDVSNWNTSNVINMGHVFSNCNNLTSLDVSNFDTSSVTYMNNMFELCLSLTSLDVSNFDTSNVTLMSNMFYGCHKLTSLDVSNFDTSKISNLSDLFNSCYELTEIKGIDKWNINSTTNILGMFCDCYKLTSLNLSNWNTSNIVDIRWLFCQCRELSYLDISNWNLNKVTNEGIGNSFTNVNSLLDIGMLYCDQPTINKVASLLPTNITQTVWVEDVDIKDLTPVEGVEFKQYAKNTEIMLTSPLLEGDKLIVKDGRLCHWHKMGMVVLDGSEDEGELFLVNADQDIYIFGSNINRGSFLGANIISNNFLKDDNIYANRKKGIMMGTNGWFRICLGKVATLDDFRQWLQANPTTVVYELASPYYELISEDPLDISLISETVDITNSSNIPLNMTINNKGLSTIAMKPSATYTVAFDKEGEEDLTVNLCGNEITTSNNVVEITTSSELGNNELIFYGDGVEVSNVRLLEGSVSGDSIPRESFEGLKNSFEDGYIPESINSSLEFSILENANVYSSFDDNTLYYSSKPDFNDPISTSNILQIKGLVPSKVYTIAFKSDKDFQFTIAYGLEEWNYSAVGIANEVYANEFFISKFTCWDYKYAFIRLLQCDDSVRNITFSNMVILEGDWTHLTEEDWNNLGKYKVEYKVIGKNKFNGNYSLGTLDVNGNIVSFEGRGVTDFIDIKPNTSYIGVPSLYRALTYDKNKNVIQDNENPYGTPVVTSGDAKYMRFAFPISDIDNIQLEEGSIATEYEPYKSYTKTYYLSSPLLEGDTIEDINGVATHVKRKGSKLLDGSEEGWYIWDVSSVSTLTNTIAFAMPTNGKNGVYEANNASDVLGNTICDKFIESNDIIDSEWHMTYSNIVSDNRWWSICINKSKLSTHDVNGFKQWLSENPTTIIYELASPILEPISTEPILCDSYVNGHLDVDSNIPVKKVKFNGTSYSMKYLQPSTNYIIQFESDNEGKLDKDYLSNTQFSSMNVIKGLNKFSVTTPGEMTHTYLGLQGIGFNASNIQVVATDRDVNFGYFKGLQSSFENNMENLWDGTFVKGVHILTDATYSESLSETRSVCIKCKPNTTYTITATNNNRLRIGHVSELVGGIPCMIYDIDDANIRYKEFTTANREGYLIVYVANEDNTNEDITVDIREKANKVECKVVGKNKWDGNWIDGYIEGDTLVYKTGQNTKCAIIKVQKNTTYTVTRKNGNRFAIGLIEKYPEWGDKVNVLEYNSIKYSLTFTTSNADEYVIIYIANKEDTTVPLIQLEEGTQATSYEPYKEYAKTIYLNSPLLKGDTIEVHNGKLCHYHKMGMVVLDGSEDEGWIEYTQYISTNIYKVYSLLLKDKVEKSMYNHGMSDKLPSVNISSLLQASIDVKGISITGHDASIVIGLNKSVLPSIDLNGFKQWLQANPTTVVYELATPYYEEIVPMQEDLIITSVKEGDLHIDTIIPISSKVTYNVNVQLLTDFEQSIVEQVQATQTTDLQSILDEEIDN